MIDAAKIHVAAVAKSASAGVGLEIDEALRDGRDPAPYREARAKLTAFVDQVAGANDSAAIVSLYPADLLPALPQWIADPAAAARADPPGKVHVVDLAKLEEERLKADAEAAKVADDFSVAKIMERRAARALEEAKRPKPARSRRIVKRGRDVGEPAAE